MLFLNLQPRVLSLFERKGRRGMRRYIEDLCARGLVQEQGGKLVLAPRPERDG